MDAMCRELVGGALRDGDEAFLAVKASEAESLPPGQQLAGGEEEVVTVDVSNDVHGHGDPRLAHVERRQEMKLARVVDDHVEILAVSQVLDRRPGRRGEAIPTAMDLYAINRLPPPCSRVAAAVQRDRASPSRQAPE